jgi:hypothetical protein
MTFDSLQKGGRNKRENYLILHELDSSAIVRLFHAKMIWQKVKIKQGIQVMTKVKHSVAT